MSCSSIFLGSALLFFFSANIALAQHSGGHLSGGSSVGHSFISSSHSRSWSGSSFSPSSHHSPSQNTYPAYTTPLGLQPWVSGYTGINRGVLPNRPIHIGRPNTWPGPRFNGFYYPYFPLFGDYADSFPYSFVRWTLAGLSSTGSASATDASAHDDVSAIPSAIDGRAGSDTGSSCTCAGSSYHAYHPGHARWQANTR